jgi:hypothetical protein
LIAIARFESEEAAKKNSDRPEQDKWAGELAQYLEGAPTFHDCTDVDLVKGGGSDDAGFVQVIQGISSDPAKLRALGKEMDKELSESRPDVLGMLAAWHSDEPGHFTQAVYFTSEAEARKGESAESSGPPDEFANLMSDLSFLDLREPMLKST